MRMNPTPLSRRLMSGASRKLLDGSRKASEQAAARVMRDRWAAEDNHENSEIGQSNSITD